MLGRVKYNFRQVMSFLEKKFRDPQTTDLRWVLNIAHKSLFLSWLAPPSAHSICSQPSLISSRLLTNPISSLGSLESIFYFTQQSETLVGASSSQRPIIWIDNVLHLSFPASLQLQSTDVLPSTQDSPTSTSAGPGPVYSCCGSIRAPHSLLQQHCPLLYKYGNPPPSLPYPKTATLPPFPPESALFPSLLR